MAKTGGFRLQICNKASRYRHSFRNAQQLAANHPPMARLPALQPTKLPQAMPGTPDCRTMAKVWRLAGKVRTVSCRRSAAKYILKAIQPCATKPGEKPDYHAISKRQNRRCGPPAGLIRWIDRPRRKTPARAMGQGQAGCMTGGSVTTL